MIIPVKGFDPIDNKPLGSIEIWEPDGNNAIRSLGLFAEGGTLNQSFFVNSLTNVPFSIKKIHLYQDSRNHYGTDIQLMAVPRNAFSTPLGSPRLRFYVCSPSSGSRVYTLEKDENGDDILVSHLTLDEFQNDFAASIATLHADGSGVNNEPMDNFLQSFDVICNVGTYDIDGNISYLNLYYNDPNNTTKRHKFDVLVYSELPYNNINTTTTDYPLGISASNILI